MPVVSPQPRYTVDDTGDRLRIVIPAKMSWGVVCFESVMLLGLIVGPFFALRSGSLPLSLKGIGLFNVLYVSGWIYGSACVMLMLLWTFLGVEVLEISHHHLTVRQRLLSLGRTRNYDGNLVYHLRVSLILYPSGFFKRRASLWVVLGLVKGPVAFEYSSKTVRYGAGLKEVEAQMLVNLINQRFPQYGRS